ncbi:hypothetical protein SLS62_006930 [Diatrype stigma]|uniref:Fucose-specific lectin n=1 Tax=Diatrype stigma TaxID=117547 RepID=A0AAN9YNP5_9PEZI
MQDDESGGIRYSLCNTNSTPIFPNDTTLVAPLDDYPPKTNTSLAGAGWWTGTDYYASIFYQDDQDRIVNSLLKCDTATGQWYDTGDYIITNDCPKASPTSGLAVILLGADDGYRVFYHDLDGRVQSVSYMRSTQNWLYNGLVNPDTNGKGNSSSTSGGAIAATFPNDNNITVITARDAENLEVSRIYGDGTWHISTFPTPLANEGSAQSFFTNTTNTTDASAFALNSTSSPSWSLPAWDGSRTAALAMAEDKQYMRSAFYIGTDARLHQIANVNWQWEAFAAPDDEDAVWPAAASRQLAAACDFESSQTRIYYVPSGSGGQQLVEVASNSGIWADAKALPSYNDTAATGDGDADGAAGSATSGAMSAGAKAGIGVGVSLGIFGVGGSLAAFLLMRRNQRRKDAEREKESAVELQSSEHGASPAYSHSQPALADAAAAYYPGGYPQQYGGGEGVWPLQQQQGGGPEQWSAKPPATPVEMENTPVYELDARHTPLEMLGEGHYREMGADRGHDGGGAGR